MNKWLVTVALVAIGVVSVRADVTLVQSMTMEGGAAAMMQPGQLPTTTLRIKGMQARSDIEIMGQTITAITDVAKKQVIVLDAKAKTAQVVTPASVAAGAAGVEMPDVDVSLKPTGKTQVIDGQQCDEHSFAMLLDFAQFGNKGQMPPEAAAMMKDVKMRMNGSMWIATAAPGAAEFTAFSKAAMESNVLAAMSGMKPGQSGGLDKLIAAAASAPGIPYLMEVNMSFEGSGPMVEAMKQMGPMKMVQRTKSVSTEPIANSMFTVPEGYTVTK